jgi:hypothetical protein
MGMMPLQHKASPDCVCQRALLVFSVSSKLTPLAPNVSSLLKDGLALRFLPTGSLTKEYKTKFRSLMFNLKDANNPDLRARVLQVGESWGLCDTI